MRLNSKMQEGLVLNNMRLVYYIVNKFNICDTDYEDFVSIGMVGLVKAASTFNELKEIKFATYAARCIQNEILMYMRKYKKCINEISLDDVINTDNHGNVLTIGDITPSTDEDFTDEITEQDAFVRLINIILNCLKPKARFTMLCKISGMKQEHIAEKLNVTQSYIARILQKSKEKVKQIFNTTQQFKEEFSMAIQDNVYKISISSKNVKEFNKVFANFWENLTVTEELPDFRISCNKEKIIVQTLAHPESFSFIAQIIKEIDEFDISFVLQKNSNENTMKIKEKSDVKDADVLIGEKEANGETANIVVTAKSNEQEEKDISMSQIREYILTLNSFTTKELKIHFPNMKNSTMNNTLQDAKRKGWITSQGKGTYIVNKN